MSVGRKSKRQSAANRISVFERDGGCVVAGSIWSLLNPCGGGLALHHRVPRGIGSSAESYYDQPNSYLVLCAVHNGLETSSSEFRKACERNGWVVRRNTAKLHKLSQIPVWYQDGWKLLDGDSRFSISERTANNLLFEVYGDALFD